MTMPTTVTTEAEWLVEQLQKWGRTYNKLYARYMFCPEWDEAYDRMWKRFDDLETRRSSLGIPPLVWQEEIKQQRVRDNEARETRYCPLTADLYDICPLAVSLDQFEKYCSENRLWSWKSTLTSWSRFQDLYSSNEEFQLSLSPSQRASYLLLIDWWNASYCDPKILKETQAYMENRQDKSSGIDPAASQEFPEAFSVRTSSSLYHSSCFELFLREFNPLTWEPNICLVYLHMIQSSRYRAGCHALAQRIAFATLFPDHQHTTTRFPSVFMNETQWRRQKAPGDNPRYLWDTEQMRTVEFDSISGHAGYICISHTWGRWRKDSDGIEISGVRWPVPENTIFEVHELPLRLKHLASRHRSRYIWIDLFCIPQDNSEEARDEISRQASIFRGCQSCIAWFNDIETWDGVKSGLRWLGLKIYQNTHRRLESSGAEHLYVTRGKLANSAHEAERTAELCNPDDWRNNLVGWFSSLWTLQEAVLCPDILLCSSDWTPLSDDWNTPIPLQTLMAFLRQAYHFCSTDGPIERSFVPPDDYNIALNTHVTQRQRFRYLSSWPEAARQLMELRLFTRLDNVLINRSPAVICTNANVRVCGSKNRAPAIMSAIGATDWYMQHSLQTNPTDDLVLDMYPLEFLQEACTRFGASFFDTSSNCINVDDDSKGLLRNRESRGTMLPFSKQEGWYSEVTGSPEILKIQPKDHESVRTWAIRGDGSVEMKCVDCVFSTSNDPHRKAPPKAVRATVQVASGTESYEDVAAYLEQIAAEDGVVYGVALYEDCYRQHGILLYGLVDEDSSASDQPLLKIGNFMAHQWDKVETRSVAWVVL